MVLSFDSVTLLIQNRKLWSLLALPWSKMTLEQRVKMAAPSWTCTCQGCMGLTIKLGLCTQLSRGLMCCDPAPGISTEFPTRVHLRCNIKNKPNSNHLLWNGLALKLCNSKLPLKITVLNGENNLTLWQIQKQAFIGTAGMECTLKKATELWVWIWNTVTGVVNHVLLTSANKHR